MHLVIAGLNHQSADISVRERLSFPAYALPTALRAVADCPSAREAAILCTCNRVEVYAVMDTPTPEEAFEVLTAHLAAFHHIPQKDFAPYLYEKREFDAAAHLMRVACGLDSLVLGDAQILNQVKTALQAALDAGVAGPALTGLFQSALSAAKRVRTETALGRGAFSVGHAAVDLARAIFSDLSHATVMLVGAGKMSELTARHLVSNGVKLVMVANRTYEKALAIAEGLGGRAIHYDGFADEIAQADIVISSTAAPHTIIHRETLAPALRKRRGRPLFLIDIALPRDVDADVNDLENVFLYNIDDLQSVVATEAHGRAAEAAQAETIAAEEAGRFLGWYRSREAVPVIAQLRTRLDDIRQAELDILRSQLPQLADKDWQHVEAAARAMMNKVAREPILRLKRETADSQEEAADRYDLLSAAREIFGLDAQVATAPADAPESPAASPLPNAAPSPETTTASITPPPAWPSQFELAAEAFPMTAQPPETTGATSTAPPAPADAPAPPAASPLSKPARETTTAQPSPPSPTALHAATAAAITSPTTAIPLSRPARETTTASITAPTASRSQFVLAAEALPPITALPSPITLLDERDSNPESEPYPATGEALPLTVQTPEAHPLDIEASPDESVAGEPRPDTLLDTGAPTKSAQTPETTTDSITAPNSTAHANEVIPAHAVRDKTELSR